MPARLRISRRIPNREQQSGHFRSPDRKHCGNAKRPLGGRFAVGRVTLLVGLGLELFPDPSRLPRALAQIVEFRPPDGTLALDLDRRDQRRIGLEGSFDPFAAGNLADDERRVEPPVSPRDHHSFVGLDALSLAFDHVDADDDRVTGGKGRNLPPQAGDLFLLEYLNQVRHSFLLPGNPVDP